MGDEGRNLGGIYPDQAGWHRDAIATSQEAAHAIESKGRAATLRKRALEWFQAGNEGTADDCAAALGESILAIRPRITELSTHDLLEPTGERRKSAGGRNAMVLRLRAMEAV